MKILFFTDVHIGKNHSNQFYLDLDLKVLDKLKETVNDKNIDMVVFGGDLFHQRQDLNNKALTVGRIYLDVLNSFNIPVKMILGNHSIYYNSSKEYNYFNAWNGLYNNIDFITEIKEDGDFLYVPWLLNDIEIKAYNNISNKFKYIFGHFEFNNIVLSDGYTSKHGYDNQNRESMIFSGHYHGRYVNKNLVYVGSPYPHTWGEKNSTKFGFCLIDTEKDNFEFIDLNIISYFEFKYSELQKLPDEKLKKLIPNNEIRILVDVQVIDSVLNLLKSKIMSFSPRNLIIESDYEILSNVSDDDTKILISSPEEFIHEYVKKMEIPEKQKERISRHINDLL